MDVYLNTLIFIAGFGVIALASRQIGDFFVRVHLPLISGFLFTGIIAGPFVLHLIPAEAVERLRFVDEIALAFIAFAAGSELYLKDLRSRFKSIAWVTIGLILATFTLGSTAVLLLADFIPFMQTMPPTGRIAVALLTGAILVARSPSAAIAIINELRAKGPFTQTVLGVTVIMDVVVIILFAINSSAANALLTGVSFDILFIILLLIELALSIAAGYLLAQILKAILSQNIRDTFKIGLILLVGYGAFIVSDLLRERSHELLTIEILIEPLLVCMIASFLVTNYSSHRLEFLERLHKSGLPIYVAFFTLTGASLELDVLAQTWPIALALFFVRLSGIFIGSFFGGIIAGEPMGHNRIRWLAFVTQAGVALGLAKEVAVEFPGFGGAFATMIISLVVLNEMVGPIFFKWTINHIGEAHSRAPTPHFDGIAAAIVFGIEGQALALARQLQAHGWQVKIASRSVGQIKAQASELNIQVIPDLSLQTLHHLGADRADAIITLLSDEEDYQICELVYEHFGTETVVVRLNDRANFDRFRQLGVLIIDPGTAIVSLLDHMVRSPSAAPLLLGTDDGQDIIDIEVRDVSLHGVALRDLDLPLDTLILSVHRGGHTLISHGYTRLKLGDRMTVLGSPESLDQLTLRLSV